MREIRSPLDGIISPFASRRFTPSLLFRANEPGYVYDLNDMTTLFKDTAGTLPVTAAGDAVARRNDKSGRGNHATQSDLTKRPLYSLLPANGVRNLANGSADVGNTTYWPATNLTNGITITKLGSGLDTDGLPYVDVRYQGTATSTFQAGVYAFSNSLITAALGQTFTASMIGRVIGGSAANTSLIITVSEVTAADAYLTDTTSAQTVTTSDTLLTATRTLSNPSMGKTRTGIVVLFSNGATIDVSYRIKAVQFELGPTRTNYQFNYAATNIAEPPFSQVGALLYDGVDDFMVTPSIDFSGTDEVFLCHGVRKTSDAARGSLVELTTGTAGRFSINAPVSAGANYEFGSVGTVGVGAFASGFAAPETAVLSGQAKISTDNALLRRNGTQIATVATDQGTGNYSNAPIYFGARAGTALFFKGYEFSSICRGAATTAAQIVGSEGWVRARTAGAY